MRAMIAIVGLMIRRSFSFFMVFQDGADGLVDSRVGSLSVSGGCRRRQSQIRREIRKEFGIRTLTRRVGTRRPLPIRERLLGVSEKKAGDSGARLLTWVQGLAPARLTILSRLAESRKSDLCDDNES